MSRRKFRATAVDQLGAPEPPMEKLELIPLRFWIFLGAQIGLLAAALSWSFLGSVPVVVNGEALYVGDENQKGSFSLYLEDLADVPLGATVKLISNDGRRLSGKIVEKSEARKARVAADTPGTNQVTEIGTRFKAIAIVGKRAPITWIITGLHGN